MQTSDENFFSHFFPKNFDSPLLACRIYGIFTHIEYRKEVIKMNARMTQILPDELNSRLEELKIKLGMSKSSIVNAAIEEYIRTRDSNSLEKRVSELEKEVEKLKMQK
jgi:predicted DNA-binding protein